MQLQPPVPKGDLGTAAQKHGNLEAGIEFRLADQIIQVPHIGQAQEQARLQLMQPHPPLQQRRPVVPFPGTQHVVPGQYPGEVDQLLLVNLLRRLARGHREGPCPTLE